MSSRSTQGGLLLVIIYAGFVSLGLPDGTIGVTWPAAYPELQLPVGLAGPLMMVVTSLAAVSGFVSGRIVGRFGTGPVVMVSCALTGSALLAFSFAQGAAWLFIAAVPLGFGAGAVDSGLNGFVARHYSGKHMNWLHACWGIGATAGPMVMGWTMAGFGGWRGGYLLLGGAQLALALVFLLTLDRWAHAPTPPAHDDAHGPTSTARAGANSFPGWLSMVLFALYVAAEMTTALWVGTVLVVDRGYPPAVAAAGGTVLFGSLTVGRILAGVYNSRLGNRRLVNAGVVLALIGTAGFALAPTVSVALVALALTGFGFAPVYPGLMHEVPRRFAPEAVQTVIGRQAGGAYVGAALAPIATGALAGSALGWIPWLVAGCVLLLVVGVRGLDQRT